MVADADKNATIGLIPAAVGGTSLDQWAIGGELYKNAISRAREAMQHGKLAGILWHQGETNQALGEKYLEPLQGMIQQFREDLSEPQLP